MFLQVIVFTGGGTGGHVYPGIAVLQALRSSLGPDFRFVWMGSQNGIEKTIAEGLGLEYRAIATGKLRRYLDWKNFTDLARIVKGYFQARRHLKELKPVFVFSKGGFVSVPPVRAAKALRIPVYSHESDLDPGLATRLNLGASQLIFCAYPESVEHFPPAARAKVAAVLLLPAVRRLLTCQTGPSQKHKKPLIGQMLLARRHTRHITSRA